jgi:Ca-activated chloride channel family protein
VEQDTNREGYNPIEENPFVRVSDSPLSTFSIDVDTASYSNVRRFINEGQLPPKDAVRLEEMINYFTYDYPQPTDKTPFSVNTEISEAPWNPAHRLVQIGLQGKRISTENLPASNLVFLIDVSGSMADPNKLPLLKSSLRLLVNELRAQDRASIVVYAGNAGLALPSTPGNQKNKILNVIDKLEAGGSTAGGAGIQLAYKIARENLIKSGNNRVILATDGDFNVGISSDAELVRLIEKEREQGIFLTVLGVGMGNLQDTKMEQLADKGNGNYAYIDSLLEAKKVLVKEMGGTLLTIAKDVKMQVEFNPAKVQAYRLVGYENRRLQNQDFNDDKKDAGELGAGHSVTALYEIIPAGVKSDTPLPKVDPLKYQQNQANDNGSNELIQVKLRYKEPNQSTSQLLAVPVVDRGQKLENASTNLKFSAAVAAFGMVLRDSQYKGTANFDEVLKLSSQSQGTDLDGYRAEFIRLVQKSKTLKKT